MRMPEVSEADRHYLQRVAEDCEQLLGPEIEMRGLELDANAEVVLRLRYRLGPADWTRAMGSRSSQLTPPFGSGWCSTGSA
jgi:hypothetical protein